MDDFAHVRVHWKKILPPTSRRCCRPGLCADRYSGCDTIFFRIFDTAMVCILGWTLRKPFSGLSGTWYQTNLHRQTSPNRQSIEAVSAAICPWSGIRIYSDFVKSKVAKPNRIAGQKTASFSPVLPFRLFCMVFRFPLSAGSSRRLRPRQELQRPARI